MEKETIVELGEIIDFLSNRVDKTMPILKSEFMDTKMWGPLQIFGAFCLFWRECKMTGEDNPEICYQYSLSRILQMPKSFLKGSAFLKNQEVF